MDDESLKVLTELHLAGIGISKNLSPIFEKVYPIDKDNNETVKHYSKLIERKIQSMRKSEFIEFAGYLNLGKEKQNGKIYWVDEVRLEASITHIGILAYETELSRSDNKRLNDSMIKTNESISSLNLKTETFYIKQTNYNNIQKGLTFVIFLAAAVSATVATCNYQFIKNSSVKTLQDTIYRQKELQLLEDILKSHIEKDSLFEKRVTDSLKISP